MAGCSAVEEVLTSGDYLEESDLPQLDLVPMLAPFFPREWEKYKLGRDFLGTGQIKVHSLRNWLKPTDWPYGVGAIESKMVRLGRFQISGANTSHLPPVLVPSGSNQNQWRR